MKKSILIEKQPSRGGVLIKRCSQNMQQNYKRTPMPKCVSKANLLKSDFIIDVLL